MPTFKGRWTARVDQEFEVDADNEDEARDLVERDEMRPNFVVELLDFEITDIEEVLDA